MRRRFCSTGSRLAVLLAAALASAAVSRPCQAATVTIFSDDFEGAFPGPWTVFDQSTGQPKGTWDTETDRYVSSNHSAYCCGSKSGAPPYSNDMQGWLDYGPFDLSDAVSATVKFNVWCETENEIDYVGYYASPNGTTSYALQGYDTGDTGGWVAQTVDLADYCGDASVWFAFIFISDYSITHEGVYIDDVLIEKTTAVPDDPYEENDTKNSAWDFTGGVDTLLSAYGGSMGVQSDADWFKISVPVGGEHVIIDCIFTHAGGNIDLELRKLNGSLIVGSYSATDGETIDYTVSAAGNYHVLVTGADSANTYDLRWRTVQSVAISLSTNSLSPTCGCGENAAAGSFDVWNSGSGTLSYSISDDQSWLDCAPSSGTSTGETDAIAVNYTTSGLTPGVYQATITVSDPAASNSPQEITVNLTVTAPAINLSTAALSPTCNQGENATADSFNVSNSAGGVLDYAISDDQGWLDCAPNSGTSTGEADAIAVNYTTSSLTPGVYQATITVSDANASNDPQTITVDLTVAGPEITLSTNTLSPTCDYGSNATADSFDVSNSGVATLDYTIGDDETWLECSPTSGDSTGELDPISVTYTTAGLDPGVYSATITVSDPDASNTPQTIAVDLTVVGPTIALSTNALNPTCNVGFDAATDQFTVNNTGSGPLTYAITDDVGWMSCSPNAGTAPPGPDFVDVTYDTDTLTAGIYTGTITVSDPVATNNPQTIAVTLTVVSVGNPLISLDPGTLSPSCNEGDNAADDTFTVTNTGDGTLDYNITEDSTGWLGLSSTSGSLAASASDVITVSYTTSALSAGVRAAIITVTGNASNSPQEIAVSLTVIGPEITLDTATFSPTCLEGDDAAADGFTVTNTGGGTLSYVISDDSGGWLSCGPSSGDLTAAQNDGITVTYTTSGLAAGTHNATIQVVDPAASNNPQEIAVTLTVTGPAIGLSTATLTPACTQGEDAAADGFDVTNTGGGTLDYVITDDVGWLDCSPASGGLLASVSDSITVTYTTLALAPGTHNATITIADPLASNTPQEIAVTLTVNEAAPAISLSTDTLSPACDEGQDAPGVTYTVANGGGGTLSYTITENAFWVSCSPGNGMSTGEADVITVTYMTNALAEGVHNATITVTAPGASNTPRTIAVTLTVTVPPPTISLGLTELNPACQEGQDATMASFSVWNSGGGTLNYSIIDDVGWLTCIPPTGDSIGESDTVFVIYTTSSLTGGNYVGTITVSDTNATNDPLTVTVNLTVTGAPPSISFSPATLSPVCAESQDASADTFTVGNKGGGTVDYTITVSSGDDWLTCDPTSGDSVGEDDTITVTYSTSGLAPGVHSATITISDPAAANSPQTIAVVLTVLDVAVPLPDLVIIDISPANIAPEPGATVDVQVTVENCGEADATVPFVVDLFCNLTEPPTAGQTGDKTEAVASLNMGESVVVTFTGVTSPVNGEWTMYAYVDSDGAVTESDESNNARGPAYVYWGGYAGMFYLGQGCGSGAAILFALALGLAVLRRR